MRPLSGGDALPSTKPRSRKSSLAEAPAAPSHVPTAFFMKSEEEIDQSLASSKYSDLTTKQRSSTYGVQSLADTLEAAFGNETGADDSNDSEHIPPNATKGDDWPSRTSPGSSKTSKKDTEKMMPSPTRLLRRRPSNHTLSNPLTPMNSDSRSPVPTSAMPSTPRSISVQSLKLSDEDPASDEVASQAIASSEEEEDAAPDSSGSFPQLVMPSIQMPSRRPFTNKGKAMGKLKLLVAGESGVGKTSLIRSIVQSCDDIVHVDDLSPSNSIIHPPHSKPISRKQKFTSAGTSRIIEMHASTKPYPSWWTDMEESRTSRKRKSSTIDTVLERNICFVDTPGFSSTSEKSKTEDINHVIDYIESQLYQTTSMTTLDDNDLVGIVAGSGGISVDAVLYLLPPTHDISRHIEFMHRLSSLTNVIPIIAKSDTLSRTELVAIKTSILARLQLTPIKPFLFGTAIDDALLAIQGLPEDEPSPNSELAAATETKQFPFTIPTYPYAVSSILGPDTETMDASLLMSPDYVQPILPSELTALVSRVFDPESIAWLRHAAAKKFLAWRRRTKLPDESFILPEIRKQSIKRSSVSSASVGLTGAALNASAASSLFSSTSPSGVLVPQMGSPFYTSMLQSPFPASSPSLSHTQPENPEQPSEFQLARYQHAAHGEQRLAEVRLAKWATDLQRSMRNERERYDELQRTERAKWLLERVGEEVASGNIVASPGGSPRADWAIARRSNIAKTEESAQRYGRANGMDSRDPLGLCDFSDEVKRRGFVLVKLLGGMSVLGACIVAVGRISGWEMTVREGGVWDWLVGGTGE
ncbi:hypothetical protein DM02DRAFT_730281 [Periconia macrospinosa]|uniref:Septin-type G domain-containing protein n=1 Tax=Periconia macrospinosa TaxID=97972 RepID=A0A2V1DJM8_9PLEO|nr:hypothetical protein DM02DRAFT_730281 [Periconia macrospinosa]